ncbi:unnamed protein product [Bemisia tabaci]|uniref:Protein CLP1 homolog n=1 Tax=Bemisia tabaci TaxID=7038 RepID=A0A9P0ABY2_BEMTA|nr:PREDICTED: protein CLP1 homolog [Bemisia tabaci]CAH0389272.1 unnamed protein product [Bemisia tabaci]
MSVEESQEINLEADQELRIEVENKNETVTIELKTGMAEIFGTEIVKGRKYVFSTGAKIAVFTWQGCTIIYTGRKNSCYTAKETPMMFYLNCHACLEQLRQKAEQDNTRGPVTMIVGPVDVGKSTLCRILLNYAVRMGGQGRRPIFVDLDVGQGSISVPGTIGALMVERPASPTEGFSVQAPLVYQYGHVSMQKNPSLYNMLVSRLAEVVQDRMQANKKANVSGVIINTCGWTKDSGYKILTHIAQAFEVDVILVLDQERLFNELVRDMPSFVKVVLLPKSGGVVERPKSYRMEARDGRVRQYFYGTTSLPLHPHSFDVKFSELKIYKIGAPALPDSCMPVGVKAEDYLTKVVSVQPSPSLLNHLLAISFATSAEEDVIQTNVAGFVCITNVDMDRQTMTILSPQPKPLPDAVFLVSEVQFMDSH